MLRQIPVNLPRSFEEALGYPGNSRWVAFYWEPCGDEAMYDDGYCSADGNWWGYQNFVGHPSVKPWLTGCNLGSSEEEATHWLLCDLDSREVYVGDKELVRAFLSDEVEKYLPEVKPSEYVAEVCREAEIVHKELLARILEGLQQVTAPSMAEIEEKMRRDQEAVEKMVADLG